MKNKNLLNLIALVIILFIGQNLMAQPTSSAIAPTHDASNVISVYSDTYIAGVENFKSEGWGITPTYSIIDDNNYAIFDFTGGIQCAFSFTPMNVSLMDSISLQCWVDTDTDIKVSLLTNQGGGSVPLAIETVSLKAGQWNAIKFLLADIIDNTSYTLENVKGVKWDNMTEKGPLYVDNILFFNTPIIDNNAPIMGTASLSSFNHNSATIAVTATDAETSDISYLVMNGTVEIGTFAAENGEIVVTGLSQSTTYTLDIYAKDLGLNVSSNSAQVTFTTTVNTIEPAESAPNPTQDADDVVSVYGDFYTLGVTAASSPYFFAPTYNSIGDNEYAKVDYSETSSNQSAFVIEKQNLTSMDYLSFDYWVDEINNEESINITLLAYAIDGTTSNASTSYKLTLTAEQWNNVVIPFNYYSDLKESLVFDYIWGIKFHDMSSDDIIYLDNIFFYKEKESTTTDVISPEVASVSIYPNPTTDYMIVDAALPIDNITIYDMIGQEVSATNGTTQFESISVRGLAAGNYFVRVKIVDGKVSMHKLIKK